MRKYNHSRQERLWAMLSHLMTVPVFLFYAIGGSIGLFITMYLFYRSRRTSPWLAFQTLQALTFQAIAFTVFLLLQLIPSTGAEDASRFASRTFWLQVFLIVVYMEAVMGAIRCAMNLSFRYPVLGDLIQKRYGVKED